MQHLLKLLYKMTKYEMDPTRTVGATDRTRDVGRMDGQMEWNQYTPQQVCCAGGIITTKHGKPQLMTDACFMGYNIMLSQAMLSVVTLPHVSVTATVKSLI